MRLPHEPGAPAFEEHVGVKTTLDYVNSFPHLHNIRILPRQNTVVVHGTTVELFKRTRIRRATRPTSTWDGPKGTSRSTALPRQGYLLSLDWLMSSWQAYWAYLAPWAGNPVSGAGRLAHPSSGWHGRGSRSIGARRWTCTASRWRQQVRRLARAGDRRADAARPNYGVTPLRVGARVFYNWTKTMPQGQAHPLIEHAGRLHRGLARRGAETLARTRAE